MELMALSILLKGQLHLSNQVLGSLIKTKQQIQTKTFLNGRMASSVVIFGLVAGMASCPPNSGLPFHTGQVRGSRAHCRFSCSEAGIEWKWQMPLGGQGF